MSIYLGVHDVASLPDGWKVYTSFTIRVKSQSDNDDIELGTIHTTFQLSDAHCMYTERRTYIYA